MRPMTWGWIKKQVKASGIKDDTPVHWIDVSGYEGEIRVSWDDDGGVEIS